jgi:L-lactate dehydrogenase (cytochrome)
MPHFENMDAGRGPPIVSSTLMRAFGARDGLAWEHLELIRKRWKGKLVVKGIISPEDARMCRDAGADGIMVSNHGGRQLDGTISGLRSLPEIARDAGGMTVMYDGGIRRGSDVLKALALGASFVFVGRPMLSAAAVAGEEGVKHAIGLLSEEIDRNMAMMGIQNPSEMSMEYIRPMR